jgi:hypothetical protein
VHTALWRYACCAVIVKYGLLAGEYTYLLRCYGQIFAFLFNWTSSLIIKPSGVAILSLICGQYSIKAAWLHGDPPQWYAQMVCRLAVLRSDPMGCAGRPRSHRGGHAAQHLQHQRHRIPTAVRTAGRDTQA